MKLLVVASGMGVGGAERIAVALARHRREQGDAVTVVAPAGALDGELASAGAGRRTFPERGRSRAGAVLSALAVARAVAAVRPDVVHAHNVKAAALAWAGTRLVPRRPPVLATLHGIERGDDREAARLLARADRVACVSPDLERRMRDAGVAPERLLVVPNGVEPAPPLAPGRREAIREALGFAGRPLVSSVGRLAAVKAHDRFLAGAAELARARSDVGFAVVGDGPERARLEALAARLGLDGRVCFTGTRADARELIAASTAVTFTSASEGLSLVALEALDAGVPVVAPDVSGMRELLGGGAGVLLADTEPSTVAGALAALLDDDAARRAMGAAGAELVRERYAPGRMLAAYDELYAALASCREAEIRMPTNF